MQRRINRFINRRQNGGAAQTGGAQPNIGNTFFPLYLSSHNNQNNNVNNNNNNNVNNNNDVNNNNNNVNNSNNNNNNETNAEPTFEDLVTAIHTHNLAEIERLLDNGVDINHVPPSPNSPAIHQALSFVNFNVANTNAGTFRYLLTYKDKKTNLRLANVDIPNENNCTLLYRVINNYKYYINYLPYIYILLALGAKLQYTQQDNSSTVTELIGTCSAIYHGASILPNIFLYEALLRGEQTFIKTLLNKKDLPILLKDFQDYLAASQRHLPEPRELNPMLILSCIDALLADEEIKQEDKKELTKIIFLLEVNQFKFDNGFTCQNYDYPRCLLPYYRNKNRIISLEELTAELQFHRELLDAPVINENFSSFKEGQRQENESEVDYLNRLAVRKTIYAKENLFNFIHADNRDAGLFWLLTNKDIVTVICNLAFHNDLSESQRKDCIALLRSFEDVSFDEKKMVHLLQCSSDKAVNSISNRVTEASTEIVDLVQTLLQQNQMLTRENQELKSDVHSLHEKVDNLTTQLSAVIDMLTKQSASYTDDNKNNSGSKLQPNTIFSRPG